MAFQHRWHESGLQPCRDTHNDTAIYQNYRYQSTDNIVSGGVRHPPQRHILHSQHSININANSNYRQSPMDLPASYNADMMSYSRAPGLLSDNSGMAYERMSPTLVPQATIMSQQQPVVCRSNRPVKICPILAGETDVCQPDRCGAMAPCIDFSDIPPMEECVSLAYLTPPVQESGIQRNPLSVMTQQRDQQYETTVLTPSTSRRSSTETPKSSVTDDEMMQDNTTMQVPSPWPPSNNNKNSIAVAKTTSSRPKQAAKVKTAIATKSPKATHQEKDSKVSASKLRARQAHSLVERRYRENLNLRISQLHESLQNTRYGPPSSSSSTKSSPALDSDPSSAVSSGSKSSSSSSFNSSLGGTGTTSNNTNTNVVGSEKIRKSDILDSAMVYIDHAEGEMSRLNHEIQRLSAHILRIERSRGR